jgi:hypothetical protein
MNACLRAAWRLLGPEYDTFFSEKCSVLSKEICARTGASLTHLDGCQNILLD